MKTLLLALISISLSACGSPHDAAEEAPVQNTTVGKCANSPALGLWYNQQFVSSSDGTLSWTPEQDSYLEVRENCTGTESYCEAEFEILSNTLIYVTKSIGGHVKQGCLGHPKTYRCIVKPQDNGELLVSCDTFTRRYVRVSN